MAKATWFNPAMDLDLFHLLVEDSYTATVPSDPDLVADKFGWNFVISARHFDGERLTNCTVDGVAGFRRLVAGGPSAGREFSDSIDRKIGQAREHRAEVVADR